MGLRLHTNDKTSYGGWFFLLRCDSRQHAMTLDIHRDPSETATFYVEMGFVFEITGPPICMVLANRGVYDIEKPDSLIQIVVTALQLAQALTAAQKEVQQPPEIVLKPLSMVA